MEVVLFETDLYKKDGTFTNNLIERNVNSPVIIAMMTNNSDVYADFQNDNDGRAYFDTTWQPLLYTPLDNSPFELLKRSILFQNEVFNTAMKAYEHAALSSSYELTIPVFTSGFVDDVQINENVINGIQKVLLLRGSEVNALIVPKTLAQWFFNEYRVEQARQVSKFLAGLTSNVNVAALSDYYINNSAGITSGDKTFRKLAYKYNNVDIIQLKVIKPSETLKAFVEHLHESRNNRPRFSFYIFLILILGISVYFLTRRRNMFR